jgi:hypothetical protein
MAMIRRQSTLSRRSGMRLLMRMRREGFTVFRCLISENRKEALFAFFLRMTARARRGIRKRSSRYWGEANRNSLIHKIQFSGFKKLMDSPPLSPK